MGFIGFLILLILTVYGYRRWIIRSRPDRKPLLPILILITSFVISLIIYFYVHQRAEVASYERIIVMSYNNEPDYYSPVYAGSGWTLYSVIFTPIIGLILLTFYYKNKQYDEEVFSEQKNFLILLYFLTYLPLNAFLFILLSVSTTEVKYYSKDALPAIGTHIAQPQ